MDLTIIFLTVNKVPEKWAEYHKSILLTAIGDYPLITVSRKPVDMPGVHLIQDGEINVSNIYFQMLQAAKVVETPFFAIVEDDSLYPREHFTSFRPQPDEFAYNMSRWGIFTWGIPTYFFRIRMSNLTLIAPTELAIKALEERFKRYPKGMPLHKVGELGKHRYEKSLRVTLNKSVPFYSQIPVVYFNHVYALDRLEVTHRKRMSPIQAYDIPYWGRAISLSPLYGA